MTEQEAVNLLNENGISVRKRSKYGILYKNGKNTPFREGYKNALRVYSKAMEELKKR